jgi:hypothetical protein
MLSVIRGCMRKRRSRRCSTARVNGARSSASRSVAWAPSARHGAIAAASVSHSISACSAVPAVVSSSVRVSQPRSRISSCTVFQTCVSHLRL